MSSLVAAPVFFYHPFTCATASHIILEESGLAYQRCLIDLREGAQHNDKFLAVNPKATVPALQLVDGVLTENQAILTYVADQVPERSLIAPVSSDSRYRAHEWMNYCATSLHPLVRMVFRPSAYAGDDAAAQRAVAQYGRTRLLDAASFVDSKLKTGPWALGENFSVVDAYLFIMYVWSRDQRMGAMPACANWRALASRVNARAAVKKIVAIESNDRPELTLPEF